MYPLEHFQNMHFLLNLNFDPLRCGRTLPLHPDQPRQPPLPCAHADPRPGERGQNMALGQEPRPRGPERGRTRQQDGV